MNDKELLQEAGEFLEITRPTSLALASEISLVHKMKTRLEELTAEKEPTSIVWEPKKGEKYHFVNSDGTVHFRYWMSHSFDCNALDHHNIYKTYELAEKAAEYQTRYNMVLQAVLNLEPNQNIYWNDEDQIKYQVWFDHEDGLWRSGERHFGDCGYPPLTDENNVQPLLDDLNRKEKENG